MTNNEKPVVNFYKAENKADTTAPAVSDLQNKLEAVTAERDELQRFSDQAQRILTPIAGDGDTDESGLEAMQRIVDERNALKSEAKRLQDIIDVGKPANENLMRERAELQKQVADLTKERTKLRAEYDDYVRASDETGAKLQAEREAAQQALADSKLLPSKEEAIQIISSVNRVSDTMAAEIYDALTAPPAGK